MSTTFSVNPALRGVKSVSRFRLQTLQLMQSLRVCLPGIVQKFYPDNQTVDVQIATDEYFWFTDGGPTGLSLQTQAQQLPMLSQIPILIPNGGGLNLTFPITEGDECMVVFTDTPLSIWFQNGGSDNRPIDQRRHSLSDGIAIFGVRSQPRKLSGYSTDSAQLRTDDGSTVIDIKEGTITITAPTVAVHATTCIVNATNCTVAASSQLTLSTNTHIDGKVFLSHTHTGVQAGGSDTGPVA